jgi:hypothetical protein
LDSGSAGVRARREVLGEQAVDLRRADASLDAADQPPVLRKDERGHDGDRETVCEIGTLVHVHSHLAKPVPLPVGELGQEALHAPARTGAARREESKDGPLVVHAD